MIARDDAFVVTLDENKKSISNAEKELIYWSDIIITDLSLEKSRMATILQNYKGTYLNAWKPEIPNWILSEKDEIEHITAIRDIFAETNPTKKGTYYDNAGNYIHLLEDTYSKLKERIQAYNQTPFIIIGQNLDNFLSDFWIKKYSVGTIFLEWKTKNEIVEEAVMLTKAQKVWIIFVDTEISKDIPWELKKNTWAEIYPLAQLEEDTSGWGYIRYIEKMINIFVSAFDTYD